MKICVFMHLFYTDMLDELLSYVENLSSNTDIEYDLIVTLCAQHSEIEDKIYRFKDNAQILIVPNRGYDVAPFLTALKTIDLRRYDYLIKIHSKRNLSRPAYLPCCQFIGSQWRQKLVEFMSTPQHLNMSLERFSSRPKIGMITSPELIVKARKEDKEANFKAKKIISDMGFDSTDFKFVAGTMFMARAKLFIPLQSLPYQAKDFEEFNPTHRGGSLAHAIERVLGFMVSAQGYRISSYYPACLKFRVAGWGYKIKQFIYYKRINSKNILHIKLFRIPVYKKKL